MSLKSDQLAVGFSMIAQLAVTCKISRIYLVFVAEHAGLGMAMSQTAPKPGFLASRHFVAIHSCADPEGGQEVWTPSPKNHKNIGLLRNTGPNPLINHKATKPVFNVGPSSASQRDAVSLAG